MKGLTLGGSTNKFNVLTTEETLDECFLSPKNQVDSSLSMFQFISNYNMQL